MTETPQANPAFSPVFGTTTMVWLLLVLTLQLWLPYASSWSLIRYSIWLGSMWGGLSVATWLLAGGRQSLPGLVLLLVLAAWHIGWMHQQSYQSHQPLSRYVLSMGGLVVCQALAMLLLGVPTWQRRGTAGSVGSRGSGGNSGSQQFGIASLLALTFVCAGGFAAAKVFETDDALFYPGIAVVVGTLVTISVLAQRLVAAVRWAWLWGMALLGALISGVYALYRLAEVSDVLRNRPSSVALIERTDLVLATFACVVTTTMLCGRMDGFLSRQPARPSDDAGHER